MERDPQRQLRSNMDMQSAISVEGLIYAYPGQAKPAIDNVYFDVREGEIFGLLGPSGAGKTTIAEIVERELRDRLGTVEVLTLKIRLLIASIDKAQEMGLDADKIKSLVT